MRDTATPVHDARELLLRHLSAGDSMDDIRSDFEGVMFRRRLGDSIDPVLAEIELVLIEHASGHWTEAEVRDRLWRAVETLVINNRPSPESIISDTESATYWPPPIVINLMGLGDSASTTVWATEVTVPSGPGGT